jgi:type I restriction enzyme M protein
VRSCLEATLSQPDRVPEVSQPVLEPEETRSGLQGAVHMNEGDQPVPPAGFVEDYITRQYVRDTPEEREAVQVLAQRLVEDYGYPRSHIQTHPQFRVRKAPADRAKSYPVDVAVFRGDDKNEVEVFLIAECKRKNARDGLAQLELYLDMSAAEVGVWFNGDNHAYLRKVFHPDGRRTYELLPDVPRYGQAFEDIGLFKRKDLTKPSNLKAVFKDIRNHLAGNVVGIGRDEPLAQQIINLLFCKIYDEINSPQNDMVRFRAGHTEHPDAVKKRILDLFNDVIIEYNDVFSQADAIELDASSIVYVVGELQGYCITEADRDAVGDAFEVFIGPALRGAEGQFFTPRNVVRMILDILDPQVGETVLDPACGSGGFLIMALEHIWAKLEARAEEMGWSPAQLERKKRDAASKSLRGIDKDRFLSKVTKAYMAIVGDGRGGIFCENSLLPPEEWHYMARDAVKRGAFDVVVTNPPFGSKIRVKGAEVLSQYDLGHRWKKSKAGDHEPTGVLLEDQPPQLLFLERCLQFVKRGGRLGIVLPESILGNPSYTHILTWMLECATLKAVVTMPEALFKTSGKGGTHTKTCVVVIENTPPEKDFPIFMADAKWCGHDSRGNETIRDGKLLDDIPTVAERYRSLVRNGGSVEEDHLGFLLSRRRVRNTILVPKYYDPELAERLGRLARTHDLVEVGDLVRTGTLKITTGVEVGKMAYGTGPVPFIRTSDITNWELKADPKQGVSEALYEDLKEKVDVRAGDILIVRDGTYLIGTSGILTESDTKILFQSHIMKLRILEPDALDPWLFFACLNSPVVKRQIRARQFTQDIIDTLGNRLLEIQVPIPRDGGERRRIAEATRRVVEARERLRSEAAQIVFGIEGEPVEEDDLAEQPLAAFGMEELAGASQEESAQV